MTYTPSISDVILMMDCLKMFWMTHLSALCRLRVSAGAMQAKEVTC